MARRSAALAVFCLTFAVLNPGTVRADDPVDEAWRLYLSADFDGALAAFERAEAGVLDRSAVLRILEGRAQIHFALGDQEAVYAALARLASLSPEYRLSPETPPDLVEAFTAIREESPRLTLSVTPEREEDAVRLSATVEGDVGGLVRALRITGRTEGGEWTQSEDEPLRVEAGPTEPVDYYAEALGAGGAVLLAEGSVDRPRRVTPDASGLAPVEEPAEDQGGLPLWAWIAIGGGGVAAAAILVAVIAVAASGGGTQAEAPVLP